MVSRSTGSSSDLSRSLDQESQYSTIVEKMNQACLNAYRAQPYLVREHAETENEVLSGGYAYRQLYELIQNAADAILESGDLDGRIVVRLSADKLVVANTGAELDKEGIVALLMARSSSKRGIQIGRFGIGFKSLLKLRGQVDIVSRTAGLRFDPGWCGERIRSHIGLSSTDEVPGMRLAKPLDPMSKNSPLREGSEWDWATTVVSADVRDERAFERLKDELKKFPSEFLLFLSTNVSLELEIDSEETRKIERRMTRDIVAVGDESINSKWKIFEQHVEVIDQEALDDATRLQARERVPISWAVQVGGGREVAGRFWAFFPTETPSRTSGILNAPWKLNADRTSLIRGPWNDEIMKACARLIGSSLTKLSTPDDYGIVVDAFPRQAERQDEISRPLVISLWDQILNLKVLPNSEGEFKKPTCVHMHNIEDAEICHLWKEASNEHARKKYLHPDCLRSDHRISRLKSLKEVAEHREMAVLPSSDIRDWLECLSSTDIKIAKSVIFLVEKILSNFTDRQLQESILKSEFILTENDTFSSPLRSIITSGSLAPAGFYSVHNELVLDPNCRNILVNSMNVKELSSESWINILIRSFDCALNSDQGTDWKNFWKNVCLSPKEEVDEFCDHRDLEFAKFLSASGRWERRDMLVVTDVPNDIAPDYLIDLEFWKQIKCQIDECLLTEFFDEEVYVDKDDECVAQYLQYEMGFAMICCQVTGSYPNLSPIIAGGTQEMPGCWQLLPVLNPIGKSRLTMHLIDYCIRMKEAQAQAEFIHPTQGKYPRVKVPHPIYFWLLKYGELRFDDINVPLRRFSDLSSILIEFDFFNLRNIAIFFESCNQLMDERIIDMYRFDKLSNYVPFLDSEKENVRHFFEMISQKLNTIDVKAEKLRLIWEDAWQDHFVPTVVPTSDGPCPISEIYVSKNISALDSIDESGRVVVLSEDVANAWLEAGAKSLVDEARLISDTRLSEPVRLLDILPEMLGASKEIKRLETISSLWVDGLRECIGPSNRNVLAGFDAEEVLLIDKKRFKVELYEKIIHQIVNCLFRNGLIKKSSNRNEVVELILNHRVVEKRKIVRNGTSLEMKVLMAVGGDADVLRNSLPEATRDAVNDNIEQEDLAGLALAVHGPALLSRIRDALEDNGLVPPKRWGGSQAQQFVLDIGFPIEFASSVRKRRDPELLINGPVNLPPLHDYQENILAGIEELLERTKKRRRAVVSLPTGAGKTRVAAQAVVELVLNKTGTRSALWVAQTDELCEQAVQCFRQLWVNVGRPGEDLRIVRLWGGQKNPIQSDNLDATLVVASIQTLSNRSGHDDLKWIMRSGIIVIDECHHAIAASYTDLMRWLGLQIGRERARDTEVPVLGLSATPWRGYNDEESDRLAARFDKRWFPKDQEDLHERLTDMQVLAKRSYSALSYRKEFMLTDSELRHVEKFNELPESAMDRIGEDIDRNDLIVESVLAGEAKSILLFANSVAHAQYLAARLHLKGCPAAAVSGETDQLARQHFTRRFRTGDLRVVCNHSVLATGFDAPKVDSILISRPVFSPVRYMQMVGRGLRGPKNGGTEHCEIVTVEDNIVNYRERLAYHYCKRFFDG